MKKINKKAYRLKQLVDHLFEYALVAGDEEIELEEPELFETVFFDLFSETCNYLEQKGFTVDFDVEWVEQKIIHLITGVIDLFFVVATIASGEHPYYPFVIFGGMLKGKVKYTICDGKIVEI